MLVAKETVAAIDHSEISMKSHCQVSGKVAAQVGVTSLVDFRPPQIADSFHNCLRIILPIFVVNECFPFWSRIWSWLIFPDADCGSRLRRFVKDFCSQLYAIMGLLRDQCKKGMFFSSHMPLTLFVLEQGSIN